MIIPQIFNRKKTSSSTSLLVQHHHCVDACLFALKNKLKKSNVYKLIYAFKIIKSLLDFRIRIKGKWPFYPVSFFWSTAQAHKPSSSHSLSQRAKQGPTFLVSAKKLTGSNKCFAKATAQSRYLQSGFGHLSTNKIINLDA